MTQNDSSDQPDAEILPPSTAADKLDGIDPTSIHSLTLAQISNYTDRPDLVLEAVEKHDPGFIKRMNLEAESFAKKQRDSMFNFGRFQAYGALGLSILAAFAVLSLIVWAVVTKNFSWELGLFFIVFYAVTQGGSSGFAVVINSIKGLFGKGGEEG